MKDAAQNAIAAARLLDKNQKQAYGQHLEEQYKHLREEYNGHQRDLLSIEEARKQKKDFFNKV